MPPIANWASCERPEVVTHVLGTVCYPCLKVGQRSDMEAMAEGRELKSNVLRVVERRPAGERGICRAGLIAAPFLLIDYCTRRYSSTVDIRLTKIAGRQRRSPESQAEHLFEQGQPARRAEPAGQRTRSRVLSNRRASIQGRFRGFMGLAPVSDGGGARYTQTYRRLTADSPTISAAPTSVEDVIPARAGHLIKDVSQI